MNAFAPSTTINTSLLSSLLLLLLSSLPPHALAAMGINPPGYLSSASRPNGTFDCLASLLWALWDSSVSSDEKDDDPWRHLSA